MKKLFFAFAFALLSNVAMSQYASKVIYSNATTHCSVTAYAVNDSTTMYSISETSDRHMWRLTDRKETQSLGLFDKETTVRIFKKSVELFENNGGIRLDLDNNVSVSYAKVMGIPCVKLENRQVGCSFYINKKTAIGAAVALGVNPYEE